jgi:DNA (cytosine-5)-methyltransferase 1
VEQDSLDQTKREESPNTIERSSPVIYSNIFDLNGRDFAGVSLITGGFPCQPFSVAGKRRGAADDRAIWPQMFRVINEARPAWVLGENVPGIIGMELDNVLSDLEGIGYATRAFVIPACAVDARHRRDRLWIMANTGGERLAGAGLESRIDKTKTGFGTSDRCRWLPEPDVGRVAHGIPRRVDRLKGLGNAIVPQVAYELLREIRRLI